MLPGNDILTNKITLIFLCSSFKHSLYGSVHIRYIRHLCSSRSNFDIQWKDLTLSFHHMRHSCSVQVLGMRHDVEEGGIAWLWQAALKGKPSSETAAVLAVGRAVNLSTKASTRSSCGHRNTAQESASSIRSCNHQSAFSEAGTLTQRSGTI